MLTLAGGSTQAQDSYPYKTAANKLYPLVSPVADPVLEKVLPASPMLQFRADNCLMRLDSMHVLSVCCFRVL